MTHAPEPESDYAHVFHAGNVGDVLKHVVLAAALDAARSRGGPVAYVDTHAGEGLYSLRTTGEWMEGVLQLWKRPAPMAGPLASWLGLTRVFDEGRGRPERYPGSPWIASRLLGPDASLTLFEKDAPTFGSLERQLAGDKRVVAREGDGLAGLPGALESSRGRATVVLVDPPYVQKAEWMDAANALIAAHRQRPDAVLLLWYPVKSWSRPHVVHKAIREAGVPAASIDLVTTPLEYKRNRLNGSGVVAVGLSDSTMDAIVPALQSIGRACAVQDGRWSLHVEQWARGG
jgi:23S rRNA (adenine2030-N6)-methyltransferase